MRERSTKDPSPTSTFPYWVALGSLAFVLLLFFSNTAEALREREVLDELSTDLVQLRGQYESAIGELLQQARLGRVPPAGGSGSAGAGNLGSGPRFDLQALLVAIDQQGYTPLELCAAHPERPSETNGLDPR